MDRGWRMGLGASAVVIAASGVAALVHLHRARERDARLSAAFVSYESGGVRAIEPTVAASDRGEVLVAWMRVRGETSRGSVEHGDPDAEAADAIGVRFSRDDGARFGPIALVRSPGGRFAADPAIAVLPDGSFVLTWLAFRADLEKHGDPHDMRVFAARAPAGTSRFETPVLVTTDEPEHEYDRPWSTVTADGTIAVAYRSGARGKAGITVATSKDGRAWQRKELFAEFNFGGGLVTTCAAGERVYVAYFDPIKGILVRSSDDGFTGESRVSLEGENVALEAPSCIAARDEVVVAYGIQQGAIDTASSAVLSRVALARSLDAGRTFESRASVEEAGKELVHPRAVAAPSGHGPELRPAVAIATYTAGAPGELRLLRAGFGASTTSAVLRGDLRVAPRREDPAWAGDYLGFYARGARAYVAYVDASTGAPQVAFTPAAL